jgi:Na+-transporting methylmalonyl-CoA/oxaloacetate decarboxylase gamma subunit
MSAEHPLAAALAITAIGMTLLLLALLFFYGLMAAMTGALRRPGARSAGRERSPVAGAAAPASAAEPLPGASARTAALQAAAAAVALARAAAERGAPGRPSRSNPEETGARDVSSWWSMGHQRRLAGGSVPKRSR